MTASFGCFGRACVAPLPVRVTFSCSASCQLALYVKIGCNSKLKLAQ